MSALISDRKPVTLESSTGRWRAELHPVGASLVALWHDDAEIVISPYGKNFYAFAGAILAPWPNRLEDGTWVFSDKSLKHEINDERGHNSNHGLVFNREFSITGQTENSIRFEIELGLDQVYPFKSLLVVEYELSEKGLRQTISFSNQDSFLIPVAFGAHPYFLLEKNSMVEINARKIYTKSMRGLPLGQIDISESGLAKQGSNRANDLQIDDCFTELVENADSHFSTRITRPSIEKTVEVWQETKFNHLMLFVFEEQGDSNRRSLAVEPQTAAANALRTNEGLIWLAPSETASASWGISITEGLQLD